MSDNTRSLVIRMAKSLNVDQGKLLSALKATVFKQKDGSEATEEQMMSFLIVAENFGLNPFCREICAFPDKKNGITPVVTVDGWIKLINKQRDYRGLKFSLADKWVLMEGAKVACPIWISCAIYIKDRDIPIEVTEFLDEAYRPPFKAKDGGYTVNSPWQTHPKRMLRNKALIQCARIAFSFGGITELDEAERIQEIEAAPTFDAFDGKAVTQESDIKKLDPMLLRLIERAKAQNAWKAIEEYVGTRFSGEELKYAQVFIRSAKAQHDRSLEKAREETENINEPVSLEDIPQTPIPLFTDEVVVSDVVEAEV